MPLESLPAMTAPRAYLPEQSEGGTAEEFQQVLRGVSFSNTSDAPDYRPEQSRHQRNSQGTVSEHDTASFTINRSNDTISFDGIETLNYTENQAATSLIPNGQIIDVDRSKHFDGGFLQVEFLSGSEATDQLTILEKDGISVSGQDINFALNPDSTVVIGSIDGQLDGSNNTSLKINLNSNANLAASRALLRAIAYHNTSEDPSSGQPDNDRNIRITFNDGGSTSGVAPVDQATAALEGTTELTVAFTSVNDPPELSFDVSGNWQEVNSGDATPIQFLSNISASDVDGEHYNNGFVLIEFTHYNSGDQISLATGNGISSNGASVLYNGVAIASIDSIDDGDGRALKLNFSSDIVDDSLIAIVLGQVSYTSNSNNPTRAGTMNSRQVSISLNDGGNEGDTAGPQTAVVSPIGSNSFNLYGLNDLPSITDLDANHTTTYIQNGTPVVLDSNVVLSDLDLESTTIQSGLHQEALILDGSGDWVEIADSNAIDFTSNFSLEAWFNPSSNGMILNKEDSYEIRYQDGAIEFALYPTSGNWDWVNSGLSCNTNTWSHVALVHSSDNVTIYLNGGTAAGGSQATFTTSPGYRAEIRPSEHALRIGARTNHQNDYEELNGKITDVRLWNLSRSAAEITDNYNKLIDPAQNGLVGYYRFASNASATNSSGFTSKAEDGTYNGNAASSPAEFVSNGNGSNGNNWDGSTLIIGRDNGAGGVSEDANDVLAANSGSNLSFNSGDVLWSNTNVGATPIVAGNSALRSTQCQHKQFKES